MRKDRPAPAAEAVPDFDVGPLSWVQGEIDQSLGRGLDALVAFAGKPADTSVLKHARTHVHQAAGAVQMVGLDAVVAFNDEVERHLARLEELPAENVPEAVALVDRALKKLRIFLDEVVNGVAPVPLKLFPEYEAMQHARGVRAASPTDLFHPDLSPRAPRIAPREAIPSTRLPSYLVKQRRHYQRGLLAWLRGDASGAKAMREAIAGIEDATTSSGLRSFWWTAGALLESIVEKGVESGFGVKQLAARVDLQIRRVAEGSSKVADRLRREVLYYVAISAPVGPQVQAVQRTFRLAGLIPTAETIGTDVVALQPLIREAREQLAQSKDTWLKFASGRAENLPRLKATLTSVHTKAAEMKQGALMKLTSALVDRLDKMPASGVGEPVAMEYATALLLAESAFENYTSLSSDFARQVDQMIARLDAARAGRSGSVSGAPMLDEMSKRAQERVLMAQVGREIQANLRHMEQVLDAFFRDNSKRAELASLTRDSQQVRGALTILGLDDAEHLLSLCQAQIETYVDPETPVSNEELELLAESLSGLGFYVEAVEQARPDRDRLIAPLIAKRMGVAPEAPKVRDSVEAAVEELRATLPRLVDEVHRAPADAAAREDLRRKLAALRDDAELIGDGELVARADAAMKELDAGGAGNLAKVVEAIAETSAPLPELSEETQRLLEVDAKGLDSELLDIFLTEAGEVLETIGDQARALRSNPGDRDALATARRGFHTLKGSGRMVGLAELGEYAYAIEKIHNRLLEEERPVTPAVVDMIDVAQGAFAKWIAGLRSDGRVRTDPAPLHEAIRRVEHELPNRDGVMAANAASSTPVLTIVAPPLPSFEVNDEDVDREPAVVHPIRAEAPLSALPFVELPELGAGDPQRPLVVAEGGDDADDDAAVEAFEVAEFDTFTPTPVTPPSLKLVADNTRAPSNPVAPAASAPTLAALDQDEDPIAGDVDASVAFDAELALTDEVSSAPVAAGPEADLPEAVTFFDASGVETPAAARPGDAVAADANADELVIGEVRLSTTLWRILSDEAEQHLATLEHELSILQFDPRVAPSPAMIRAAHTLCGIHRTGGFHAIASLSKALEQALLALDGRGPPMPAVAQPILARAVDMLRRLVSAVQEREPFRVADEDESRQVLVELDVLRQDAHLPDLDAESKAAQVAAKDDEAIVLQAPNVTPLVMPEVRATQVTAEIALPEPEVDPLEGIHDEIEDPAVLSIFLEEAAELFPAAGESLRAWRRAPEDESHAQSLRRTLHTFKGSARMAGAMRLGELTHLMESRLLEGDALAAATPERFEALDTDLDRVAFVLDRLREGEVNVSLPWVAQAQAVAEPDQVAPDPDAAPAIAIVSAVEVAAPVDAATVVVAKVDVAPVDAAAVDAAPVEVAAGEAVPAQVAPVDAAPVANGPVTEAEPAVPAAATPTTGPATPPKRTVARSEAHETEAGARAMLRVRADTIDRLVNEAGEVAIARSRVEGELRQLKSNLLELTNSVIRLKGQVREIEIQAETQIQSRMSQMQEAAGDFDPLEFDRFTRFQELTRSLAEGVNDVSTVQQALLRNLDDADSALLAQARLSREVQQKLFAIRTVPFASLSERLYRTMRSVAKELGKRANLDIVGGQTELDRSVLEKIAGPLEHLLRNALDHGIESRDARRGKGKSETGEIMLTVRQAGNEIAIELADDGGGIDLSRVRDKAVSAGLIAADAQPTDAQLYECLFQPGFSTASKVTAISGRGVGMDVVRAEIAALGGRVDVASEIEKGSRFTMSLPLTLAVAQAVLVRAGGRLWAFPAPMVEQVQQIREEALLSHYARREVEWQQRRYPFHYLPMLLGDRAHSPETQRYNPVILLRTGQGLVAIHVDEMIGNQEIVIKNIGPQLARVSGISGATVLGNGEIVLILNPVQLAQRAGIPTFDPHAEAPVATRGAAPAEAVLPLVLIVDDSLTVRKITSRLLSREGFAVATAKDGVDALQAMSEKVPDVILLDIEMPRMDGFEFTKTIKADPKFAHVPIVMITSRTAEKHRARAAELGVDLYLGKPFQEEELLRNLREMLGVSASA